MVRKQRKTIAFIVSNMLVILILSPFIVNGQPITEELRDGPFINELEFHIITQDDQQVLALQDDEVDLIGNTINPTFHDTLVESSNIEIAETPSNGFGYFTINTAKYPYNITAFRRAIAFALDKQQICDDLWNGLAIPHDSVVPQISPFSFEEYSDYNYYEGDIEHAAQLLDDAGFELNASSGFREAPNGSELSIVIASAMSSQVALDICGNLKNALNAIDIAAEVRPLYLDGWVTSVLYFHGNYDIIFLASSFNTFDADWLAYEFWSEYADKPYWNFAGFQNETYDSWREMLLYSTEYTDVMEAAHRMQDVLLYECPIIVVYERILLSAYRTDVFEGHVNDVKDGAYGWWTNYKVRMRENQGGPYGGTFRRSNALDVDTFNLLISFSVYTRNVLEELYDSLFVLGPDGEDIPWLVESYTVETHQDNDDLPEGHVRFIFEIMDGVSWSDGQPLTAEDIAHTLTMFQNLSDVSSSYTIRNMTLAYTRTPTTLVVEFDTESFWHLHSFAYVPIFPKHIMEEMSIEEILNWDPSPGDAQFVTSGPFILEEYEAGELIRLIANENYTYRDIPETPTSSITTETPNPLDFFDGIVEMINNNLAIFVTITLITGILITILAIRRYRIWN